ncbi:MAG TPA: DUF2064 domain-containing protein [Solirubrobacteraceae bacterium]|nr:DUF2064 domain-containing protein [Solirubrobacteraceae bacterium]
MAAAGSPPVAAVLVIAGDGDGDGDGGGGGGGAGDGGARPGLAALLGAERLAALEQALVRGAREWAEGVAPGRVRVVAATGSAALGEASARAFAASGGPVLLVWPVLPFWRPEHAAGALDDLAHECDVSVGPVYDGGFYLVALARPAPALFAVPDEAWSGADALSLVLGAVHAGGMQAGLLRAERGLRGAADVRAALADPLLAPELRAILEDR